MGKEDVAEVLQWMDLAMGTNANSVFSDESPVTITLKSVLARLQQIRAESDLYKNEANRYKRELEVATANAKIKAESDKNDIARLERELESVNANLDADRAEMVGYKLEKNRMVAVFKDVITLKNAKIRQLKVELKKVRATCAVYQSELNFKIAAKSNAVISVQEKIGEKRDIMEKIEGGNLSSATKEETSDTTIRGRLTDISKLSSTWVYSHPNQFAGAQWKMKLRKNGNNLEFRLYGMKSNDSKWSCSMFTEFQLLSHKSEEINYRVNSGQNAVMYTNNTGWGSDKFISFKDLFDEEKEYVKDDSIIVASVLKEFPSSPSN